jgi:hypothetical protein
LIGEDLQLSPAQQVQTWEEVFSTWARPPGKTEESRCRNAETAVRNAVQQSEKLRNRKVGIFTHGSYRNNVNVRQDSDVDIAVLCLDSFHAQYPEGVTAKSLGHSDASYTFSVFKKELEEALVNHFGRKAVHRGNKAIDIRENSYHVEADVAPFFEHRRYTSATYYHSGAVLYPDCGGLIINWPEQHYRNGVQKNKRTSRSYKGVVRIMKKLRNYLQEEGVEAARKVSGFLIECLAWNTPDSCFDHPSWDQRVQATLLFLWSSTKTDNDCLEWGEVSELKYVFKGSPGKRESAHAFIDAAWNYIGVR